MLSSSTQIKIPVKTSFYTRNLNAAFPELPEFEFY